MGVLIDTGVFVQLERAGQAPEDALAALEDRDWYLSCITASELLHGVHRAVDPAIRERRSAFVEAALTRFEPLSIGLAIARTHARLAARLAAEGRTTGVHDLWIAAACVTLDLTVVTTNVRHSDRVPGLQVQSRP